MAATALGLVASGGPAFTAPPAAGAPAPLSTSEAAPLTNQDGTVSGMYPADIQAAYGLTDAPSGAGTVGVLVAHANPTLASDLVHYRAVFGLPACTTASGCLSIVDQRGGSTRPSYDRVWGEEEALDVQAVSAACPACSILVVEADGASSDDLAAAADTAVRLGADALSASYGAPEGRYYAAEAAHYAHPGVPTFAGTGDGDSAALYPGALPGVIGVSGTRLSGVDPFEPHAEGWVTDSAPTGTPAATAQEPSAGSVAPLGATTDVPTLTARLAAARLAAAHASNRLATAQRAAIKAAKTLKRVHTVKARTTARKAVSRTVSQLKAMRRADSTAAARVTSAMRELHLAERAADDAAAAAAKSGSIAPPMWAAPDPAPRPSTPAPTPSATLPTPGAGGIGIAVSAPRPSGAPTAGPTPPPSFDEGVDNGDWDPSTTIPDGFAGYTEAAWSGGDGGCSMFVPAPDYQRSIATGCSGRRAVADIAADATSLATYNSGAGGWMVSGGTSLATPLIAAMAVRSGRAADLAVDGAGASVFTAAFTRGDISDIVTGAASTCFGGAPSCAAAPGWDHSTGFGTPRGLRAFRG